MRSLGWTPADALARARTLHLKMKGFLNGDDLQTVADHLLLAYDQGRADAEGQKAEGVYRVITKPDGLKIYSVS